MNKKLLLPYIAAGITIAFAALVVRDAVQGDVVNAHGGVLLILLVVVSSILLLLPEPRGDDEPIGPQTPAAIADRDAQLDVVARIAPYGRQDRVVGDLASSVPAARRDDSVGGCLRRLSKDIDRLKQIHAAGPLTNPLPVEHVLAAVQSEINQALRVEARRTMMAEQFLTNKQVAQIAFEAAGAATAPLLQDHPHYVFPSERVSAGVDRVLLEHGIDVTHLEGYGSAAKARERAEKPAEDAREFGEPAILSMDPSATLGDVAARQEAVDALEHMSENGGLVVEVIALAFGDSLHDGPEIQAMIVKAGDVRYRLNTSGAGDGLRLHVVKTSEETTA